MINSRYLSLALLLMSCTASSLYAQKEARAHTREGNKQYNKENYLDSEISYRKALEANDHDSIAMFNLGNSLYRQQDESKVKDALMKYIAAAKEAVDGGNKSLAAKALYNAGNVMMAGQEYQKAVEFYKESLRNDPTDNEARYNFLLAKKLLDEQQKQDQQNKDKQDKDQQNKDKDKQDKQKQDQQKQDQQNKDDQKKNDQQQDQQKQDQQQQQDQQQDQPQQMSPEQAEAILNANNRDEKDTQKKVQEMLMQKMQRRKSDKDW